MAAHRHVAKFRIRKNDTVMVVTGRDRGKTGKVLRVLPETRQAGGRAPEHRSNAIPSRAAPGVPAVLSRKRRRFRFRT